MKEFWFGKHSVDEQTLLNAGCRTKLDNIVKPIQTGEIYVYWHNTIIYCISEHFTDFVCYNLK